MNYNQIGKLNRDRNFFVREIKMVKNINQVKVEAVKIDKFNNN